MTSTGQPVTHKVLLVDDDDAVRAMMNATLERRGFDVVAVASVTDALRHITTESFDVLITDLHMPNAGDGFAVVTAMRHSQPDALTLLVSGYPDVQSAMAAILLEADQIIVKPFEVGRLAELVREKMLGRKPTARLCKERVGMILQRCLTSIVEGWLVRAKQSNVLSWLPLSDDERTGHLRRLVEDLALRLSPANGTTKGSGDGNFPSAAARAAISAGHHSGNACSRVANAPGDHIRDATGQSEPSGFQLAFTRRHDDRGRSGSSVDTVDGQLHESQAKVCGSLAIASYCHEHTGHL